MTQPTTTSQPDTLSILSAYVDYGFAVLPVWGVKDGHCACPKGKDCPKSQGKHPNGKLVPNGVNQATRDKAIIAEWVRLAPTGNWALRTGEPLVGGGFSVVLDKDPRNGGNESLAQILEHHGDLGETPTADTGGAGNHFVLRSSIPCASRAPAPGIDLIAEGKYFLVYPSRHMSGGTYDWALGLAMGDVPFAEAPDWVVEGAKLNQRPSRDADETARNTVLGEAFAMAGLLGMDLQDGSVAVKCPWAGEHSDARGRGEDSSTVILPPAGGSRFGGFRCLHGHCSHRKWEDVVKMLPATAVAAGRAKYPMRAVRAEVPAGTVESAKTQYEIDLAECQVKLAYKTTKNGYVLRNDIVNAITILTYDPRWKGILQYDDFAQTIRFTREPPWYPDDKPKNQVNELTEQAIDCLDAWFRRTWLLEIELAKIIQAAGIVSRRAACHPLRDYLDALEWDGTKRVDTWLSRYLGVEQTTYSSLAGRKWLVSACARAFKPGCKADHVLILEGPQGRGKSTALQLLTSQDWFSDTPIDIGNKDAYVGLRGKWVIELAELSSLRKADVERAKAFFSSPVDTYRPPYGRIPQDFPRQCIFAGTVNLDEYFVDETGNRRFWPVECGIIDLEGIAADRAQIWAEAVHLFKNGATWWPSYEERPLFEREQDHRVVSDVWQDTIGPWLNSDQAKRTLARDLFIPASSILEFALRIQAADHDRRKISRLNAAMAGLGWVRIRPRSSGRRQYAYKPSSFVTAS